MQQLEDHNENYITGWIKTYRSLEHHWIWKDSKYLKCWLWFLFRANHKNTKVLIGSDFIDLNRGSFITSIQKGAIASELTIQQFRTFLSLLEKDKMVFRKSTSKLTQITICNYDVYQDQQQTNNKPTTNQQQANNKPATTDKNVKELKQLEELKEIFNQKSFSNIRAITAKRAKHVKARIKEYDYATILQVIDISENSDFLKGKNATNWKLDFDWMLDPNNFVKILEGKYGSNNSAPTAPAKPVMTQEERSKLRRYAKFPIKEGM